MDFLSKIFRNITKDIRRLFGVYGLNWLWMRIVVSFLMILWILLMMWLFFLIVLPLFDRVFLEALGEVWWYIFWPLMICAPFTWVFLALFRVNFAYQQDRKATVNDTTVLKKIIPWKTFWFLAWVCYIVLAIWVIGGETLLDMLDNWLEGVLMVISLIILLLSIVLMPVIFGALIILDERNFGKIGFSDAIKKFIELAQGRWGALFCWSMVVIWGISIVDVLCAIYLEWSNWAWISILLQIFTAWISAPIFVSVYNTLLEDHQLISLKTPLESSIPQKDTAQESNAIASEVSSDVSPKKTSKNILKVTLVIVVSLVLPIGLVVKKSYERQLKNARDSTRISKVRLIETALDGYFSEYWEYPVMTSSQDMQDLLGVYLLQSDMHYPTAQWEPFICYDDAGVVQDAECNMKYAVGNGMFGAKNSSFKLATSLESALHYAQSDGGNIPGRYEVFSFGGAELVPKDIIMK